MESKAASKRRATVARMHSSVGVSAMSILVAARIVASTGSAIAMASLLFTEDARAESITGDPGTQGDDNTDGGDGAPAITTGLDDDNAGTGGYGGNGKNGGNGGYAQVTATRTAFAVGGNGGAGGTFYGYTGGTGGIGGDATAISSGGPDTVAYAAGGGGGIADFGGKGGSATANATAYDDEGDGASASATAIAGEGGGAWPGGTGGASNTASATARAQSDYGGNVSAYVLQEGSPGGWQSQEIGIGNNGVAGMESSAVDHVAGWSQGGAVTLEQDVVGGAGGQGGEAGSGYGAGYAGSGGAATSSIITGSHHYEISFDATTTAAGGSGGSVYGDQTAGSAAGATASTVLFGSGSTSLSSTASSYGGGGGASVSGSATSGAQGNSVAATKGMAGNGTAWATAIGGGGGGTEGGSPGSGGSANALAQAQTTTGTATATAIAKGGDGGEGMDPVAEDITYGSPGGAAVLAIADAGNVLRWKATSSGDGGTISVSVTASPTLTSGSLGDGTSMSIGVDALSADLTSAIDSVNQSGIYVPTLSTGTANFTQSGGTLSADGSVSVSSGSAYNMSGGTLSTSAFSNAGTFSNSGGTVVASITNAATVTMSGGTISSGGTLTNSGTFNLSGGTINSSVVNDGTISITGGTVNISTSSPPAGGTFTNDSTGVVNRSTLGTTHIYLPSQWNGGTISVGTFGCTFVLDGAANIADGATLHLVGEHASTSLTVNGTLSTGGSGTISLGDFWALNLNGTVNSGLNVTAAAGDYCSLNLGADEAIRSLTPDNDDWQVDFGGHTLSVGTYIGGNLHVSSGTLNITNTLDAADGGSTWGDGTVVFNNTAHTAENGNYITIETNTRMNADQGSTSLAASPSLDVMSPVYIGGRQHFSDVMMDGGSISVDSGGNKPIFASTLETADGCPIDVSDSGMAIASLSLSYPSNLSGIREAILSGEITSSAVTSTTALGYATASEVGRTEFYGETVSSATALIMYTYAGDANLDGSVTVADEDIVTAHMGDTGQDWADGDFNYDGIVNSADLAIVEANLGDSGLGDSEGAALPDLSVVPEPGWIAGVLLSIGTLTQRRRRS